jgi:hypothetical protein
LPIDCVSKSTASYERLYTFFALVVLKCLEAGKSSTSSDHLMAEASLVFLKVVVVVDLLVVVLAAVLQEVSGLPHFVL